MATKRTLPTTSGEAESAGAGFKLQIDRPPAATVPLLTLPPLPETLAAVMTAADAAGADVSNLDGAVDRATEKRATAQASLDAALASQGEADLELAKETDEDRAVALETKGRELTAAVAEARTAVERQDRLLTAVLAQRAAAIEVLEQGLKNLEAEVGGSYRTAIEASVEAVLAQAVEPFVAVLRQIAAVDQRTLYSWWFAHLLDEIKVPRLRGYAAHIADGRLRDTAGGAISISASWRDDEALVALHEAAHGPTRRLGELKEKLQEAKSPLNAAQRASRERETQERLAAEAQERSVLDALDLVRAEERRNQPPPWSQQRAREAARDARRQAQGGQPGDEEFLIENEAYWAPSREVARARHAAVQAERLRALQEELTNETNTGLRYSLAGRIERLKEHISMSASVQAVDAA